MVLDMKATLVTATVVSFCWAAAAEATRGRLDPLIQAKCDAQCWSLQKPNRTECRSSCSKDSHKAGSCPSSTRSGGWDSACVKACTRDAHCSGTARCCRYDCGATCQEPPDLLILPDLPSVPTNVTAHERRRVVRVSWSAVAAALRVLYVLEEQHHIGPKYEEGRLGEWNMVHRTQRINASLQNIIKGGRWYRFRVAAVSSSGTRGYSRPSPAFTSRLGPRAPAAPRGLRAVRVRAQVAPGGGSGTVSAVLKWRAPASDLPVTRYKVYWSRRLKGVDDGELDSVYVKHRTVMRGQTQFELTDLQPSSMYFLQVQALSQYGLAKLRSDKASIVLNTTSYKNESSLKTYYKQKIEGLRLQKIFWKNDQLYAQIGWKPFQDKLQQKYVVQWWSEPGKCRGKNVNTRKQFATITSLSQMDLDELEFECTYTVLVSRVPTKLSTATVAATVTDRDREVRSALAFTVPACTHLRTRYKSMQNIKCPTT